MNMVLMALEALPRGGEIAVSIEASGIVVSATGTGARIEEPNLAAILDGADVGTITPRTVQSYFTSQVVRAAGGALDVETPGEDTVLFKASIPL